MQILDDIWSSIKGNTKTRIKDPIVGTFIVSWSFCNWDKLATLFFGSQKVDERIETLSESMSVLTTPSIAYKDIDLILLPSIITLGYLFFLPLLSLWVKEKQKNAILSQHNFTVDLDIEQAKKQWLLNKERLRSNPDKEFLTKDVELDLQREKDRIERRNRIKDYINKKAEAASAITEKAITETEIKKDIAKKQQLEIEEKQRKGDREKQRFEEQSAVHNATMASNRFPAVFYFMDLLSNSLKNDGIIVSINAISSCIAAIFGYENFDSLLQDKNFTNETVKDLKYIYLREDLIKELDAIVEIEQSENEDFSSGLIHDHIYELFTVLPFQILSEESIVESVHEDINENQSDIINSEELSGPIAEADTFIEEIELDIIDVEFDPDSGLHIVLSGSGNGPHIKESDVGGRGLSININATCEPILGKYGLKDYELEIQAKPTDYE
jgi:hypothetical protein